MPVKNQYQKTIPRTRFTMETYFQQIGILAKHRKPLAFIKVSLVCEPNANEHNVLQSQLFRFNHLSFCTVFQGLSKYLSHYIPYNSSCTPNVRFQRNPVIFESFSVVNQYRIRHKISRCFRSQEDFLTVLNSAISLDFTDCV